MFLRIRLPISGRLDSNHLPPSWENDLQKFFVSITTETTCRRTAATICLPTPCRLTISSYLFARWHLFRHIGYLRHQQQVDLWPFDLESGVRVTCDVGNLYVNFSLPRPLCSRVRPAVRDRQTWDRQTDRQTSDVRRQTKASLRPIGAEA